MKKILILIILVLVFSGCQQEEADLVHVNKSFIAMNTVISYQAYAEEDTDVQGIVEDTVISIERLMSRTDPNSFVYKINQSAGTNEKLNVSDDLARVLDLSINYQEKTNNLFRITIYPLVELWDIMNPEAPIPTSEDIKHAIELSSVDYLMYDSENQTLKITREGAGIDLGGIAKGYAADLAVERLMENGVNHGFISLGGGVQAFGGKPNGDPWVLGLQNPIAPQKGHFARYEIYDGAVVTSGDYQRYKVVDGIVYHHIIDPRSGFPVQDGVAAVTIFTDYSSDADAYSTALFVMGFEEGLEYIDELEGVEVMFVFHDKSVYLTEGLRGKITITDQEFYFYEDGR